jgi:Fic/DOC family
MIVDEAKDQQLFWDITNRNLLWQYDFLINSIRIGLVRRHKLDGYIISALNFFATVNLSDSPGCVRSEDVYIEEAPHTPPGHSEVGDHYLKFIPHLHSIWDQWDALHLAAYVLWKINWIHPFMEGNGRTARAAMYYVISIKMGRVLEGSNSIPTQIRASPKTYYPLLRATDESFKKGGVDLEPLAGFLGKLLNKQLKS